MPLVPSDEFQFCGPTYLAASPVLDSQRSINLYPDPGISSSKSRFGLTGRQGMSLFSANTGPGGHSLWAGNGRLFVASGAKVKEINNTGAVVTDYGVGLNALGNYKCPMVANGTQLLICDPLNKNIFNINPGGPSLDKVFNGVALEYLDGFYFSIAAGASLAGVNPNQINRSASGDGTNWAPYVGTASFAIETSAADQCIQLAALNGLLYIFGQKTLRVWYDAGTANFPLARVNGGVINLGCLAPGSVVKFSNSVLWLGSDQTGYAQVYMMQGLNPVRVSNPAIETFITNFFNATLGGGSLFATLARAFGYQENGHTLYELMLTPLSGLGLSTQSVVYDLTTGLWHERVYAGQAPNDFASVPNFGSGVSGNFVISQQNGNVYSYGSQFASDDGTAITYTRIAPHVSNQRRWIKYPRFELDMAQGDGNIAPILDYSNGKVASGALQFLGYNYPLAQSQDQGAAGTAQQFYATQLGRSRDRTFKVTITESANLIRIANAALYAEAA